jgi:hypothetical protein
VKTERSREIRGLVSEKARAHRRGRIGTLARVVLEGDADEVAVTGDYLKMPALDSLRARGRRLQVARIRSDGNGGTVAAGEG